MGVQWLQPTWLRVWLCRPSPLHPHDRRSGHRSVVLFALDTPPNASAGGLVITCSPGDQMPVRMKPSAHETPTDRPLTPLQLRLQQRQEFFPRSRQRKRPFLVAGLHGKHLQPTPFPRGQHRRTHASANRSAVRRRRSRPPPDPARPPRSPGPGKSAARKPVFQLPRVAAGARSPQDPDRNPLAPPRARASRRPPQPAPQGRRTAAPRPLHTAGSRALARDPAPAPVALA